jgi:putative flippase GtrA
VYDATVTPAPAPGPAALRWQRLQLVRLSATFRRFAVVGVANTVIDVVLFAALHAPLGILAANFVSTSAGMAFSFLVNGRFTFGARRVAARDAVLFVAANGSTMWVLQPLLITLAHVTFATPLMIAKVGALGVSVVANFLLYRYVVWPLEPSSAGAVTPLTRPAGLDAAPAAARR